MSEPGSVHMGHEAPRVLVLIDPGTPSELLISAVEKAGHEAVPVHSFEEACGVLARAEGSGTPFGYGFIEIPPHTEAGDGLGVIRELGQREGGISIVSFHIGDGSRDRRLEHAALDAGADDHVSGSESDLPALAQGLVERLGFLQALEERLRVYRQERDPMVQALQQLGVGVAVIDRHFRVWYMNSAFRERIDYPLVEGDFGRSWLVCRALTGDCHSQTPCLGRGVLLALSEGTEVQRIALLHTQLQRSDGSYKPALRYYQLTARPMLTASSNNEPMAVIETAQDITDTLRVSRMDKRERLDLLAQVVLAEGFSRCRIYVRDEGSARRLRLAIFAGGDMSRHEGHAIDLDDSHAAARRGQWEAGAAWFPPGYEREPWHEELDLPENHMGWVDWPVFGPAGRLLGWIAADTAPPSDMGGAPICGRAKYVGRPVSADDVETLRMYADHAAQILSTSVDGEELDIEGETTALSELDSNVLASGATPSDAAEWLLEAIADRIPSAVHTTVRYISDWTQSAVLFASRGPLVPYIEREVSLYDVRRPSSRAFRTGEAVVHRKGDDGRWSAWMRGWLDAGHPGFEAALEENGIVHILIHPLHMENRLVGTLGLFLSERDAADDGKARWMVERALERAQACATAARMQERLRSEAIEQAMPDLLPAIAHKLGTPLFLANREIRAFRLDVEEGSATIESAESTMDNIKRHMDKVDAIRRQFLEMSAASGGHARELDLVEVLTKAVADAVEGVCDEFRVEYLRCPDRAPAFGGEVDLTEVFYELAANAVRALDGQGLLCIEVSAYPESNEAPLAWRIVFENAGKIPEADKARIFDPFYTTNLASGTGLGLALVRRLLRANEGTIREIGTDSVVFEVLIPTRAESRGGGKGDA